MQNAYGDMKSACKLSDIKTYEAYPTES